MWIRTPRGLRLAAELWPARGEAVIVMAHGFCADRHFLGRFDQLAHDFTSHGYDVLTFDFSGCGQSDKDVLTIEHQVEDLRAVLGFLREEGYDRIGLFGHSLGGMICLQAGDVEAIVVAGTPTDAMHYDWNACYGPRRMAILNETGTLKIGPWQLSQQSLRDFSELDQNQLLRTVTCPVLLLHGTDQEERELLARSRTALGLLPAGSQIQVIDGARHSFQNHIAELAALACGWYAAQLPLP
jgi:pimeloyl-ACP methyl ester carboxylesterase